VFDLVAAVETPFWWGEIATGMREIFRVPPFTAPDR
jgi:hypothetical protein